MENDECGVLVGWSSQNRGANIVLDIQTFQRQGWDSGDKPEHSRVFMTRSQAAVLANYLLRVSGTAPPPRRRSWFARLFD